jgi:hypothetical protein
VFYGITVALMSGYFSVTHQPSVSGAGQRGDGSHGRFKNAVVTKSVVFITFFLEINQQLRKTSRMMVRFYEHGRESQEMPYSGKFFYNNPLHEIINEY